MTVVTQATPRSVRSGGGIGWLEANRPKVVLAPSFALTLVFVYGFILWTVYLSFSKSRLVPNYDFVGLEQYYRLWSIPNWYVALTNLAIYGTLYITFSLILGLVIAILLDQRIRAEGLLRAIYLYPMAVSFIVTGPAWQWFLIPGLAVAR